MADPGVTRRAALPQEPLEQPQVALLVVQHADRRVLRDGILALAEADKGGAVRAIRIATAAVNGGRVFDMELDNERGRLVWELDVASSGKAYDVKINACTGKVVQQEDRRLTGV